MRRFLFIGLMVFLLTGLLVSCGDKKTGSNEPVLVVSSEEIELERPNISGYNWYLYKTDDAVCLVTSKESADAQSASVARFTVEAVAEGTTEIEFRFATGTGEHEMEKKIGRAVYAVAVASDMSITVSRAEFDDPSQYSVIENVSALALENLKQRCVAVTLPVNDKSGYSWYYVSEKENLLRVAQMVPHSAADGQWGTMDYYLEGIKSGKSSITFYFIQDGYIDGTITDAPKQETEEEAEQEPEEGVVIVRSAEEILKDACARATYYAKYTVSTDKKLQETIIAKEEKLPDTSVTYSQDSKQTDEELLTATGLDLSDPELHYHRSER